MAVLYMIHPLAAHQIALNGCKCAHACLVVGVFVCPCVSHLLKCVPVVPTRSHVACSDK